MDAHALMHVRADKPGQESEGLHEHAGHGSRDECLHDYTFASHFSPERQVFQSAAPGMAPGSDIVRRLRLLLPSTHVVGPAHGARVSTRHEAGFWPVEHVVGMLHALCAAQGLAPGGAGSRRQQSQGNDEDKTRESTAEPT